MKKRLSLMVCLLLGLFCLPYSSWANPFLICDPANPGEDVILYQIELNGIIVADVVPDLGGIFGFKYDLASLVDGNYTARARVSNIWGWSDFSDPFDFRKGVPNRLVNLGLSKD